MIEYRARWRHGGKLYEQDRIASQLPSRDDLIQVDTDSGPLFLRCDWRLLRCGVEAIVFGVVVCDETLQEILKVLNDECHKSNN